MSLVLVSFICAVDSELQGLRVLRCGHACLPLALPVLLSGGHAPSTPSSISDILPSACQVSWWPVLLCFLFDSVSFSFSMLLGFFVLLFKNLCFLAEFSVLLTFLPVLQTSFILLTFFFLFADVPLYGLIKFICLFLSSCRLLIIFTRKLKSSRCILHISISLGLAFMELRSLVRVMLLTFWSFLCLLWLVHLLV